MRNVRHGRKRRIVTARKCVWRGTCTAPAVGRVMMRPGVREGKAKPPAPVAVGHYCGTHLDYFAATWEKSTNASMWVDYD